MSEELDIRSLSVTDAAKVLKVQPKTIRTHIRRGLPLVTPASPCSFAKASEHSGYAGQVGGQVPGAIRLRPSRTRPRRQDARR